MTIRLINDCSLFCNSFRRRVLLLLYYCFNILSSLFNISNLFIVYSIIHIRSKWFYFSYWRSISPSQIQIQILIIQAIQAILIYFFFLSIQVHQILNIFLSTFAHQILILIEWNRLKIRLHWCVGFGNLLLGNPDEIYPKLRGSECEKNLKIKKVQSCRFLHINMNIYWYVKVSRLEEKSP